MRIEEGDGAKFLCLTNFLKLVRERYPGNGKEGFLAVSSLRAESEVGDRDCSEGQEINLSYGDVKGFYIGRQGIVDKRDSIEINRDANDEGEENSQGRDEERPSDESKDPAPSGGEIPESAPCLRFRRGHSDQL